MNIQEFNAKVKEAGKRLFEDNYSFSSTGVDSINYGHLDTSETTYRLTIFLKVGASVHAESPNIDIVFDILECEHKKLLAKPSIHIEL
jgi:hypothetical protein